MFALSLLACLKDSPPDTMGADSAACSVSLAPAATVPVDPSCLERTGPQGGIQAPFELALERSYSASGQGIITMPAIANLDDDNGDGVVDEKDLPEIAFTTWKSDTLVVLSGATGQVLWSLPDFKGEGGVSIADIDGDGRSEVVAFSTAGEVVALRDDGEEAWRSRSFDLSIFPQSTVADLDGDGAPEVIGDVGILRGADGSTVATLAWHTTTYHSPVVADLDGDGLKEILLGNRVYDHLGEVAWTPRGTGTGSFSAVANVDGDPQAEVFIVSSDRLYRHGHDGEQLGQTELQGKNPGPPCMADFDGDGQVEIAVPTDTRMNLYESDGALVWSTPIDDASGRAGCSGFDVDDDGAFEVLHADQDAIRIFDGATGAVRYEDQDHSSGTLWEYPVVADIDGDRAAELCVVSNVYTTEQQGDFQGLRCFGHAGAGWAPVEPTWPIHDFAGDNLGADGSVPPFSKAVSGDHSLFRARPYAESPARAQLSGEITERCVSACSGGTLTLSLQVWNSGGLALAEGTPYTVFAREPQGGAAIASGTLPAVASGEALEGLSIALSTEEIGSQGVEIYLGEASWEQCDPSAARLVLEDWGC